MERVSVRYQGRVQGVGFRATAKSIAIRHGIAGCVRNVSDGTVELEAQSLAPDLAAFLADLRVQMGTMIQTSHVCPIPLTEGETGFSIRSTC